MEGLFLLLGEYEAGLHRHHGLGGGESLGFPLVGILELVHPWNTAVGLESGRAAGG